MHDLPAPTVRHLRTEPEPARRHGGQCDSEPAAGRDGFRTAILNGLRARPRQLSSLYFYDDCGSALFERIMQLPEYYLTRAEQEILERHADDIADLCGPAPVCVVDLGAGSGEKARCLLRCLMARGQQVSYAPVDVSAAALLSARSCMRAPFPMLPVRPVQDDYVSGLQRVKAMHPGQRLLVLWLGSSIGNLLDAEASVLLGKLASCCDSHDVLLVGFDLLKQPDKLVAAYSDSQGVTAEFNFNLLRRINRELEADFDLDGFLHHATFLPRESRMESYLISRRRQSVTIGGEMVEFEAWDPIRTEVSCKYSDRRIAGILQLAGLEQAGSYRDSHDQFADIACRQA